MLNIATSDPLGEMAAAQARQKNKRVRKQLQQLRDAAFMRKWHEARKAEHEAKSAASAAKAKETKAKNKAAAEANKGGGDV